MRIDYKFNKHIADFIREHLENGGFVDIPGAVQVVLESDSGERQRPCLVVGSTESERVHPRMNVRQVDVEFLTQRNDTPEAEVDAWVEELEDFLESRMLDLAQGLLGLGVQLRHWVYESEISAEDERRAWRAGMSYRATLLEVI